MTGKIEKIKTAYKNKKISPSELCKHYTYNIKKYAEYNSYITVTNDLAKSVSEHFDSLLYKENIDKYPLFAIPAAVKDNISTAGILTTCASKMLSDYVPIYDAFAYKKLIDSGVIMLGKTNMDEFAMGSTNETSYFGGVKNPVNSSYVSGGSSGGSACAVKKGMAVFALGSDTGGSVRQPASFCGCVGFKPSYSSVSRFGLIAYASSFDQIGIISNSVSDVSVVYDTISEYDKMDDTCSDYKRFSSYKNLNRDVRGIKIGLWGELFESTCSDIGLCYGKSLSLISKIGKNMQNFAFDEIKYIIPVYYILACAQAASNLSRYDGLRYGYRTQKYNTFEEMVVKSRTEGFGSEVKKRIMLGNYVLSEGFYDKYYKKACVLKRHIGFEINKLFNNFDIIITPTVCVHPFKFGEVSNNKNKMYMSDICTVIANICGLPAISIPCGYDSNGMPVGLQIVGKQYEDNKVLSVAYAVEDLFYKNGIVKYKSDGEENE